MTADTRTALLDLAQELAQTRGLNGFSFKNLAEGLGIRTASIHHHFPTKADLAREIMIRYRLQFQTELEKIEKLSRDPHRKLASFMALFRKTLNTGNRICLCGMLASEFQTLPKPVQHEVQMFYVETEKWLSGVFNEGRSQGTYQFIGSAANVAKTFLDTLEGGMISARTFRDEKRLVQTGKWLLASLQVRRARRSGMRSQQ